MPDQAPALEDQVTFVARSGAEYPAVIVHVHDERAVDLRVMAPDVEYLARHITFGQSGKRNTWYWPESLPEEGE